MSLVDGLLLTVLVAAGQVGTVAAMAIAAGADPTFYVGVIALSLVFTPGAVAGAWTARRIRRRGS